MKHVGELKERVTLSYGVSRGLHDTCKSKRLILYIFQIFTFYNVFFVFTFYNVFLPFTTLFLL